MKKYAVIMLLISVAVLFCACGKNNGTDSVPTSSATPTASAATEPPAANAPDETIAASKTFQYFSGRTNGDYLMKLRTRSENGAMTMTTAVVGGKTVYSDIETENGRFTNFEKEGKTYTIMHDMQAYMITDSNGEADSGTPDNNAFQAGSLRGEDMVTGTVEIDGESYDYEQFPVDGATVRYCFAGDTLRYMLTKKEDKESTLEVVSLTNSVPDSIYDIPAGYENLTK